MMSNTSIYLEGVNGRMYEVFDTPDYPVDDAGEPCKCVAWDEAQCIEIAAFVKGKERPLLLAEALGVDLPLVSWRLTRDLAKVLSGVSCLLLSLPLAA